MSLITDPSYLRNDQYKNSTNFNARANLHRRFSTNPYGWLRWLFDQLPLRPGVRALEVGGGPASLWRENADRLPPDLRVYFSDFSIGMAQEARQALAGDDRFAIVNLDVQAIPAPDGNFDIVIANHMLYHVPDRPRAVREMARVLKPGGRLYAGTNGVSHLREMHDLIHEFAPRYTGRSAFVGLFDLENAAELLGREFACVEIRRYEDALWVTEARPLVNYVVSLWWVAEMATPAWAGEFEAFLQAKINAGGGIHITKDAGLAIGLLA